jgi:hypothetical protein
MLDYADHDIYVRQRSLILAGINEYPITSHARRIATINDIVMTIRAVVLKLMRTVSRLIRVYQSEYI